ncbi:MAG: L,D-transpeptidase [Candidatus Eiseniibacteriota bacterium]
MCRFDHSFNFASGASILCIAIAGMAGIARIASGAAPDQLDLPQGIGAVLPWEDTVRVVINVPARRLRLVRGNELVRAYPVAVGRPDSPTPTGQFRILQKTKDPTWAPKGRKPVPPGPQNPLGHRWMRISEDGYGIHATNEPGSIGRARSHGCIRMSRSDAEDLFERVTIGTPVEIVYELNGYDDEGEPALHDDVYGLAAASTN